MRVVPAAHRGRLGDREVDDMPEPQPWRGETRCTCGTLQSLHVANGLVKHREKLGPAPPRSR